MTGYSEAAAAIRRARAMSTTASADRYRLQLRRLELERAAGRADRGEGARDPALLATLRPLRAELRAALERRDAVARALEKLSTVAADVARLQRRLEAVPAASAALTRQLAEQAEALARAEKPEERERLQADVKTAQSQRASLAESAARDRDALTAARKLAEQAAALGQEARVLDSRMASVRREIDAVNSRAADANLSAVAGANEEALAHARRTEAERKAELRAAIAALYDGRTPQELLESWDDSLPIALLPLRIETRWKLDPPAGAAPELWVRVYPDDIGVTHHEPVLTAPEADHGQGYWRAIRAAGENAGEEAAAWDTLARRFGGNRAAWVAKQTRPQNWDAALADAGLALEFGDLPTKPDAWTAAPHSRVLPERFVLLAWRGDRLIIDRLGELIDDVVVLGPAPLDAPDDGAAVSRDPSDQTLKFGADFAWVRDFGRAVDAGLGFRVPLTTDDVRDGFDRLLVLGLKLSADAPDAQALVEDLLDSHHYSQSGFELLRQGTPTNNTDGNDSGYSRGGETGVAGVAPDRFTPKGDRSAASDGQRLADYLGIDYAPLLHTDGAESCDHVEAVAMNRALYAGTLGYYVDHMLNEVIGESGLGALRRHFVDHVTGRGPLPAIRVGSQPYGILPTSSLSRWEPSAGKPNTRVARFLSADPFEGALLRALRVFDAAFGTLAPGVKQLGAGGNVSSQLLEILGLQPNSAEFHQRVGYSFDYLRNLENFAWDSASWDAALKMIVEGVGARTVLRQLGYVEPGADDAAKPAPFLLQLVWRSYQTTLDARQLIDGEPLSETAPIKPFNAAGKNYLDWLLANAVNAAALEAQNFGGAARPGALLYMLVHFSLVMEGSRAIHGFLGAHEINADELLRSRKFLNVGAASPSIWEVFRAPADRIASSAGSSRPLYELVHASQLASGAGQPLQEQKAALAKLCALPTARLERALVEHIDTLTYRLDAWESSLFARRLHRQRGLDAPVAERRMGTYLGAYGYLENLRAAGPRREKVSENDLSEKLRLGTDNLYRESGNGGYVHAPSLNHATAAALLRNGYLTHASAADPDALAVNLSSGRVQRAKYLIEGIKNGQSLETLLGVAFERGLHDWTTRAEAPVVLDQLKPLFRVRFPIVRTRVPQASDAAAGASEVEEDYQVVNGLTLARTGTPFPYGIAELLALSTAQRDAIVTEKAAIENTLDALRDVLTAESAYQLALGNFERAAAVLQSAGSGNLPPDLEVLETPRGTGISFTQRLAVQFDSALAVSSWGGVTMSARAQLEPALNAWLGELLGPPATVCCRVAAVAADGTVLSGGGGPIEGVISLAELDVQPIDFVYLVRSQTEPSGAAELETRVRYRFARSRALADDVIVRISFADSGGAAGTRAFAEVLPLADRLRKLLGTARPLDAAHFQSASKDAPGDPDNPGRVVVAELLARVSTRLNAVRALFATLRTKTNSARNSALLADIDALRTALVEVARAGTAYAMPRSTTGAAPAQRDALVLQADALLRRADELGAATDERLAAAAAATRAEQAITLLGSAVKAWLGNDVVLLPRFEFGDVSAVTQANAAREALLSYVRTSVGVPLPVEEWLHGVSCVRAQVHDFEMMRAMADAARLDPLPLLPLQLPFRTGDSWLGAEYPPTLQVMHDTVSMVQHLPQGFNPAGAQCGLLIDEWTESVPAREEITGLAFNFNAPNSAPPQALLLAVTPHETGSWSWDDLVDSVLDTFRRAKLRAVEPDAIGELSGIGTLLPAVLAEFGTSAASVSLDYSQAVAEISRPVTAVAAAADNRG